MHSMHVGLVCVYAYYRVNDAWIEHDVCICYARMCMYVRRTMYWIHNQLRDMYAYYYSRHR